jgi:hypothetical protein
MNETLLFALVGAGGGLIRALIGVRKALLQKRKFMLGYFIFTIISAAVIGGIIGAVVGGNKILALAVGYAGTDLLEGLAKSVKIVPPKIG